MNLEILNMEVVRALYIVSAVLFILTLGGLSNQETSRKGNIYGISAMLIAVIATFLGPQVSSNYGLLIILILLGGSRGLVWSKVDLLYVANEINGVDVRLTYLETDGYGGREQWQATCSYQL